MAMPMTVVITATHWIELKPGPGGVWELWIFQQHGYGAMWVPLNPGELEELAGGLCAGAHLAMNKEIGDCPAKKLGKEECGVDQD